MVIFFFFFCSTDGKYKHEGQTEQSELSETLRRKLAGRTATG